MGISRTIIACMLGDFPALAEAIGFRRTGPRNTPGLPPVGYSESRGQALIWVDQRVREDLATIDYAALSRTCPIWVLSVVEANTFSILERYEAGTLTCCLWASPERATPLTIRGACPFDLAGLERRNAEYTANLGFGEEPSVFTVPIVAFFDMTGVEYDGAGSKAVEPADAGFPIEVGE